MIQQRDYDKQPLQEYEKWNKGPSYLVLILELPDVIARIDDVIKTENCPYVKGDVVEGKQRWTKLESDALIQVYSAKGTKKYPIKTVVEVIDHMPCFWLSKLFLEDEKFYYYDLPKRDLIRRLELEHFLAQKWGHEMIIASTHKGTIRPKGDFKP